MKGILLVGTSFAFAYFNCLAKRQMVQQAVVGQLEDRDVREGTL